MRAGPVERSTAPSPPRASGWRGGVRRDSLSLCRCARAPPAAVAASSATDLEAVATVAGVDEIPITGEMIRLGQLLKLAGIVGSGAEVRDLLAAETVTVNGEREERRGRQLHPGDLVRVGEAELQVIRAPYASGSPEA